MPNRARELSKHAVVYVTLYTFISHARVRMLGDTPTVHDHQREWNRYMSLYMYVYMYVCMYECMFFTLTAEADDGDVWHARHGLGEQAHVVVIELICDIGDESLLCYR